MRKGDNFKATIRGTNISATFQANDYFHAKNKAGWVFTGRKYLREQMEKAGIVFYNIDIESI